MKYQHNKNDEVQAIFEKLIRNYFIFRTSVVKLVFDEKPTKFERK